LIYQALNLFLSLSIHYEVQMSLNFKYFIFITYRCRYLSLWICPCCGLLISTQ